MKRNIYFVFCLMFLFYACDKNDDATIKANPTELFCSEVPETHISEKLLKEPLSHKELMKFVENKYYKRIAIYDCFTRNDSTFYEIQSRDNIENNLNCLAMIIGGSTYYLNIANDHTIEWEETIGCSPKAYCHSYTYNAETKIFKDFHLGDYSTKEFKVLHADQEYLIFHADIVYNTHSRSNYNCKAQFSRIVYKVINKSDLPMCDIIDKRK